MTGAARSKSPSISLCMIVRDEEAKLGRALAAAAAAVDEIVVVDTGSADATRDVARRAGARVFDFEWIDDFAAARNCSLAQARCDWVLVLDADEELEAAGARERLSAFASAAAARARVAGGQIELENVLASGERSRVLMTRFFPRRADLRYRRRIHEQLWCGDRPLAGSPTGVRVRHDGYAGAAMPAKCARNEALLRAQLEAAPDDSHDWYQLGRTLEVAGRFEEALTAYERSVELVRDADPHLPHLLESAALCLRHLGRSRQALAWLSEVEADFQDRADTVFLIALLALDAGDLERAERGFLRCLELGRVPPRATAVETSLQAATLAPAHNLGVLYEFSGRPAEALAAYERALAFDPRHAGSLAGIERLRASAGGGASAS